MPLAPKSSSPTSASAPPRAKKPTFVVGDVHGHPDVTRAVLRQAELIDAGDNWIGGDATLWFTGDFADRGPDGVGAIELAMKLEAQAPSSGGAVHAILGNHDVMLLAAQRFGPDAGDDWKDQFWADWMLNGGQLSDLRRLTPDHVDWLARRPALAKVGHVLLAHADSSFYLEYGSDVDTINAAIADVLTGDGQALWDILIELFTQRREYSADPVEGPRRLKSFLDTFAAARLVHGHTPISLVTDRNAIDVTAPYVYANGHCVNVDAGLFLGSPGFIFRVPDAWL